MTQSSGYRFFGFRDKQRPKTAKLSPTPPETSPGPAKVHGWLMNVPGYRDETPPREALNFLPANRDYTTTDAVIVDSDNNSIPIGRRTIPNGRPESIASVSSGDSINLDDLIQANFTADVDDETDLSNLADLDLDDSAEDFWKMDLALSSLRPSSATQPDESHTTPIKENVKSPPPNDQTTSKYRDKPPSDDELSIESFEKTYSGDADFDDFLTSEKKTGYFDMDNKELDWSPDDNTTTNHALKSAAPTSYTSPPPIYSRLSAPSSRYAVAAEHDLNRTRSGSLSSENSLTSQSTITAGSNHYSRYGMTPVIHPSESTSTSSRSLSRLSNYSAGSQASSQNSSIPRPRTGSAASSGMPTPSRSITTRHSPTKSTDEKPMLPRASSRIGTHLSPSSGPRQKLAKRASHIPAPPSSSSFGKPMPQRTTSNSSSRSAGQPPTQARSVSRIGRASHIPTVRESSTQKATRSPILSPSDPATRRSNALSRPTSPPNAQTHHQSPSRLGMRSASACGPRQSIFDTKPDHPASGSHARPGLASQQPRSRTSEASSLDSPERRNVSAHGSNRSSGLRPPGGARSVSRIGTVKKA